jgi:hypothetical protein
MAPSITFLYKNYAGKLSIRRASDPVFYWGQTSWHPEDQWMFKAYDLDKEAHRDFALKDCNFLWSQDVPAAG